jgi:hypothetical protein
MSKLQIEDLETRQLLSGAGSSGARLLSSLWADAPRGDRIVEFPLRGDHIGLTGLAERGCQGGDEVGFDQPGSFASFGFGSRGAEIFFLRSPFTSIPGVLGSLWEGGDVFRGGPDHPGAGSGVVRDLEMARGNAGAGLAPPLGPTNSSSAPGLASPADDRFLRTDRTNSASAAALPTAVAPLSGRLDPPVFPSAGTPAWETHSRDVLFALVSNSADRSSEHRSDRSSSWPAAPEESSFTPLAPRVIDQTAVLQPFDLSGLDLGMKQLLERLQGLALPYGQVSGVLTMLPPLDVAALDLGMNEFLDKLEGLVGQRLAEIQGGAGAYAWVVAVAAAAAACEIARRQLRPASGDIGAMNSLAGFQPDRPVLR